MITVMFFPKEYTVECSAIYRSIYLLIPTDNPGTRRPITILYLAVPTLAKNIANVDKACMAG